MEEKTKQFIFLYPLADIFRFEIKNGAYPRTGEEAKKYVREYSRLLNQAIDLRYRQKGFGINYAVFDDTPVSRVINLTVGDRVINVGLNVKEHRKESKYPDQDFILNQLGDVGVLRVAGFHLWDCVDKLARGAYERGVEVLVDEDLTELFKWTINKEVCPNFRIESYPTCFPKDDFMGRRANRPWLVKPQKHL